MEKWFSFVLLEDTWLNKEDTMKSVLCTNPERSVWSWKHLSNPWENYKTVSTGSTTGGARLCQWHIELELNLNSGPISRKDNKGLNKNVNINALSFTMLYWWSFRERLLKLWLLDCYDIVKLNLSHRSTTYHTPDFIFCCWKISTEIILTWLHNTVTLSPKIS